MIVKNYFIQAHNLSIEGFTSLGWSQISEQIPLDKHVSVRHFNEFYKILFRIDVKKWWYCQKKIFGYLRVLTYSLLHELLYKNE